MSAIVPHPHNFSPPSPTRTAPPTFEFTKRKRWADLLISELSGTVILVLSPQGKVLFCGAAVGELLGWKEEDLVDAKILDFVHDEDIPAFIDHFKDSAQTHGELSLYVRLKAKSVDSHKWLLFEMRGHPHFVPGQQDCTCIFAMARPYPSRNTAMLDTFLELKMENERLRQRLAQLRAIAPPTPMTSNFKFDSDIYMRTPTSMPVPPSLAMQPPHPYFPMSSSRASADDGIDHADDEDDSTRKKKAKKLAADAQHVCVTCGRTDSPEWRKGPLGPKTLCNACGLRWAKRNSKRKADAESTPAVGPGPPSGSGGSEAFM